MKKKDNNIIGEFEAIDSFIIIEYLSKVGNARAHGEFFMFSSVVQLGPTRNIAIPFG